MSIIENFEEKFELLLKEVIPLYENCREGDVLHIKWLVNQIRNNKHLFSKECQKVLLLAIFHDIGYYKLFNKEKPFNLDVRKAHSDVGSKLSRKIMRIHILM